MTEGKAAGLPGRRHGSIDNWNQASHFDCDWRSCMVMGRAERVTLADELGRAVQVITNNNPTLTPAINRTGIGPWHRLSNIVVYRVRAEALYGRKTAPKASGD